MEPPAGVCTFGCSGNPSERQAALRLLLLKMKSRAGRSFLLACAVFLLCGLMTAESRVREQDVAAEEMRAPGAGAGTVWRLLCWPTQRGPQ